MERQPWEVSKDYKFVGDDTSLPQVLFLFDQAVIRYVHAPTHTETITAHRGMNRAA